MLEFGVMVVIVVILASLALPTLTSLRRQSTRGSCQANLRELLIGAYLYADENRGFLPPMEFVPGTGEEEEAFRGQPEAYGWFTVNPLVVPFPETWGEWQEHEILPWTEGGRNLMRCPQCSRENHAPKNICYQASPASGWSRRLYQECREKEIPYSSPWPKVTQLQQPDRMPGYLDGGPTEMANGFGMLPEWMLSTEVAKREIFRHNGKANLAFMDGHAQSIPLLKALSTTEHGEVYWCKEFSWIPQNPETP